MVNLTPPNAIISPRQPWMNRDLTPGREFYKMVAKLPSIITPPPVVTGSKGGNAALASLISALASIGVITDETT